MNIPRLETARTVLRPFTVGDVAPLHAMANIPEVAQFLWDAQPPSLTRVQEIVDAVIADYQNDIVWNWAIEDKLTRQFIGHNGLRHGDEMPNEIEMMFAIHPDLWNSGYATETTRAVIKFAFDSLPFESLIGRANPQNIASWRVFERLGFSFCHETVLRGETLRVYRIRKT